MAGFRVGQSNKIPEYVWDGIKASNKRRKVEAIAEAQQQEKDAFRAGTMPAEMFFRKVAHIKHGAGCYEAKRDLSIWELTGDTIVRREDRTREVEAILDALGMDEEQDEIVFTPEGA